MINDSIKCSLDNLGIIILNYNNIQDTIACIESIWENVGNLGEKIIVVDNGSTNREADTLQDQYGERIVVIRADRNYGYARGNNIGLQYGQSIGLEYFCVLNNDTIICENFFFDILDYLDVHQDVAFVSPAILGIDKKVQGTGGTIKLYKGTPFYYNWQEIYEDIRGKEIVCDILLGSCMLFRSSTIQEVGLIPEVYFLFYEETEWCIKAKKLGKKSVCLTSHYILHLGSVSVKKTGGLQEYLMERNRVVFCKRNSSLAVFIVFLIYDFTRTLYQGLFQKQPLFKLIRYHSDGLFGRIDKRFPFVWINTD